MPKSAAAPVAPDRNIALAKALAADGRFAYVVAGEALINPRYLARVIKGTQEASPAVKTRLAAVLNVPEDELFDD